MFRLPHSASAKATLFRVASVTISDDTFKTIAPSNYVALLWDVLKRCVAPAEQRLHAHCGSGDIPAALVKIDVSFPWNRRANASIIGPLTTDYPLLVRSLKVLTIVFNDYDESGALGAFATLATHLQELKFCRCGLTSVQGLRGRCEYLRKVNLYRCEQLSNIDALADRVHLEEVDVSFIGITSIEPLRTCPALTRVDLYSCQQLSSIDALAGHQQLQVVAASVTDIASIEPLRSCPNLTEVYVYECTLLPDDASLPGSATVYR